MNMFSKLKSGLKKSAVKAVAVLALIATFVVPVMGEGSVDTTASSTPRFNFMQNDVEMLTVANATKGQSEFVDPLEGQYAADAGDILAFKFYFHNGMENTTATNVTLKAVLPGSLAVQHNVLSSLSSDQTQAITDTVYNNTITGYGDGYSQVKLNSLGRLEYIPGSTKIWRSDPAQNGVVMPDGIVSNSGLNIGSVNGCWQYAGYVTFKVIVKSPAQIQIAKTVSYPGSNSWVETLNGAKEGETVAWKIALSNTGQSDANGVLVKDTLPSKLTFVPGSAIYYGPDAPSAGYQLSDTIVTTGVSLNSLMPGAANSAYIIFKTKIATALTFNSNGISELVNWASATYSNQTLQDQAKVVVSGNSSITIDKKVWNGSLWSEQNSIKFGEIIKYRIVVANTGQVALNDITITDIVPVYTKYIAGSTKLNGSYVADGLTANGLNIASLAAGSQAIIEFEVSTYGCPPIGEYTLTNTAYAAVVGIGSISDTASTIMTLNMINIPSITNL